MEKTKKTSFLQQMSNGYKSNKYLSSIITITLTMAIAIGIVFATKVFMPSDQKVSVATNPAEEAFYNGNYDLAIDEYKKTQDETKLPLENIKIAEIYSIKGDYVKSNELLNKVYEQRNKVIDTGNKQDLEEQDEELTNYMIFTYFMNGESKKALEYGNLFLKDHPNGKKVLNTMFTIYMVNNDKDKAKEIVEKYSTEELNARELAIAARMNMVVGNWDNGFKLLKSAWEKDNNEITIFDTVEQVLAYNKDEFTKRVSDLEKNNQNEELYKLCMAKIHSMSKEDAQKSVEIVKKIQNKECVNATLIEYGAYKSLEKQDDAQNVLNEIISNDPTTFLDYYVLALYNYETGSYKNALENVKKSIVLNKEYSNTYGVLLPNILIKQSKGEEKKSGTIEPYFRTALYKDLFNSTTILKIAQYYSNIVKDSNKSLEYYNIASQINPNNSEIYYNIALIKINNQRIDEAVQLLNKSIKLDSKNAKYYRTLANIYLSKSKNEEAIKAIRSAYTIDPNDIATLNNAGYYYICVDKNSERALTNFKAAYDGINDKTDDKMKQIITDNYNRLKKQGKNSKTELVISQFKLVE